MVWINEFHYDNVGADVGEFVEIAGVAGTVLDGLAIVLVNGSNGQEYNRILLTGTIPDQGNGFGTFLISYPNTAQGTIQNGAPDGIALINVTTSTLIQFLSYEGVITNGSITGIGTGLVSTDVGVAELGNAAGTSIGLVGTGDSYDDFTWSLNDDDTPGGINNGQSFGGTTPISVSVGDPVATAEGDDGSVTITFTVTRSGGTGAFGVDFATVDGTAEAGADYVATNGRLEFAEGETSKTVTVTIVGDTVTEADETFSLALSNASTGVVIEDGEGVATILNDDGPVAPPAAPPFINEFHYDNDGADVGEFVEIAGAAGTSLSDYAIVLVNGSNGQEYNRVALTGTIPDQSNGFGTVSVSYAGILQNGAPDGIALINTVTNTVVQFISYEGVITNGSINGIGTGLVSTDVGVIEPGNALGTSIGLVGTGDSADDFTWALIGDDTPGGVNAGQTFVATGPTVSVDDVTIVEGNEGTSFAEFTITRSSGTGAASVSYGTADGTANAGSDYVATAGTVNFVDGQTIAKVQVAINGDTLSEADETFFLNLSNATGLTITDAQGQAVIQNDDAVPPSVSIDDVSKSEGDSGTTAFTFTVTRTGGTGAFSVDFATVAGTATADVDYASAAGTLDFAEGELTKTITIEVAGDTASEVNETFRIELSNATDGAQIADASGTGTILNDELTFIHDIQGTSYFSPLLTAEGIGSFNIPTANTVTVRAVITALDGDGARQGFYITEEKSDWDADSNTSEGIFVMTRTDGNVGSTLTSLYPDLKVGDLVTITASVMEYQAFQNQARTVLTNPTGVTVEGSGYDLPTLVLDASQKIPSAILTGVTPDYFDSSDDAGDTFDAQNYALSYFETIEGMLVTVPDMVVADGFVSTSGGQPFFKAYSTVHADANQINDRGGYTIAGDPPLSPPDTANPNDGTQSGGRYLHDGDVNPDIFEIDFTDFAIDAPAGLTQNATMGDKLGDVTGIVDFDFTDLKLFVTKIDPAAITDTAPVREETALGNDARALTYATFNVENLDARDNTQRFKDIAEAIAKNLNAPDILSIEEIQDNNGAAGGDGTSSNGTDASQTWELLVAALNEATGQNYTWVDELPTYNAEGGEQSGNIRVGFLYNLNRVTLGDMTGAGTIEERRQWTDRIGDGTRDAGDKIAYSDDLIASQINSTDWAGTRKSLLGEFTFNGNTVFVAGNHLPSKGGSGEFWQLNQNLASGAPENSDWDQRSAVAEDIYSMLNLVQTGAPNAGVISGGDYNDFYFYRPLEAATGYVYADGTVRNDGAKLDNLTISKLSEAERYTYTFDGRAQAIDHVLVNQKLAGVASYDVVHLNTGYNTRGSGDNLGQVLSDHDPAVASFDYRSFSEVLKGSSAGETIEGFGGDDVITGGGGNDLIDGGEGKDTARYLGNRADYAISLNAAGDLIVRDKRAGTPDGTDTVRKVEKLSFLDADVTLFSSVLLRDGTIDGSASTSDVLTGASTHNSFFFDIAASTGKDVITNFQKIDVIVTSSKLFDSNNDGIIQFSKTGILSLDGKTSAETVQMTGVAGLRFLGEADGGVFVYADAKGRPTGAIEGTLRDDVLNGDAGDARAQSFFFDTALGLTLGKDKIANFGAKDEIVTTKAIFDGNNDGTITFSSGKQVDLARGTGDAVTSLLGITGTDGKAITSLQFDGTTVANGVTYYHYSLAGTPSFGALGGSAASAFLQNDMMMA